MKLVGYLHITFVDAIRHSIYKCMNNDENIYYVDYKGKSILLNLPEKYKINNLSIVLSKNRETLENEKKNNTFGQHIYINEELVEFKNILDYNLFI
jgi:hypothetical protein